jgi:outer membrane protein assembly factor BamB
MPKKIVNAILLFLIFAMIISLFALPTVTPQEPMKMKTYAYIGATPNPVGVGQEVLLHVGITHALPDVSMGWEGLSVTIEKPDGTTTLLDNIRTDSTAGTGKVYIPDIPGNYTLQAHFPEQVLTEESRAGEGTSPPTPAGTIMLASDSEKLILTVTEEAQLIWPGIALPTEYWTRPINGQFYEWNSIAGNMLSIARGTDGPQYTNYNEGPETAHMLWAKPVMLGGLAGGMEYGPQSYDDGSAYEGVWLSNVIISGVLYYNQFQENGGTRVEQNVVAVDLHTGEELWCKPLAGPDGVGRRLSFGQVFYWDSYNKHAVYAYLWTTSGSTWHAFDPFTGRWVYSMSNVPSGTNMYGPKGEIYRYSVNFEKQWMILWNSSRVVSSEGSWLRDDTGRTLDATAGIEWNITIPQGLTGTVNEVVLGDKVVGTRVGPTSRSIDFSEIPTEINSWAFSLKPGQEGTLLFNNSWKYPNSWLPENGLRPQPGGFSLEDDVFTVWISEIRQHFGFSISTGQQIWGPTEPPQHYLDYWNTDNRVYDHKLFSSWMSGQVSVYDIKTGEQLWTFKAPDKYSEILWAGSWPLSSWIFAGDKVYIGTREHTFNDPKPRGMPFVCLNVTNGEVIFQLNNVLWGSHHGGAPIMGDSILVACDGYDQRLYAVGKGPSATTVNAPMAAITLGSSLVIQGTVTDISPGTKSYALATRFPNGVPAVSDESMSDWMLYVYKQFERPANATGIEVSIGVIDSNGNYRNIGTTSTDSSGTFSYQWTPDIPGKYTVIASFEGTKSYYGSSAQTAFAVDEATATTAPQTIETQSMADLYLLPGIASIIITIIIIGAILALLLLRKRP